jgi:MFS family permease
VIVIAVPLAFFLRDPRVKQEESVVTSPAIPISDILKNRNFYLLALGSMCSIGAVGGINQHLKLYLRDLSFTQAQAAQVMSLVLFMSLAGRLLMGFLADLMKRKHVMILIYLIVGFSIPLLLMPDFPGRIYLFAVIFGIGLGGDYMIIPLMAGDLFGVRTLGRIMGIILVADGLAESLMPMFVGAIYRSTNSYNMGFSVLIAVAIGGAIIVSFLRKAKTENVIE